MKDFKKKEDNSKMVLHRFTRQVTSNKPFENPTKIRLILDSSLKEILSKYWKLERLPAWTAGT